MTELAGSVHDLSSSVVYSAINQAVLELVPTTAKRLLDLGCGDGALGRAIKQRQRCEMIGVTHSPVEASSARIDFDHVEIADLNVFHPEVLGRFDCIICSHVLEHLTSPGRLVEAVSSCVATGGSVIIALPNVLFWRQRLEFLLGRFRYTEGGLMDSTHLKFFDWTSATELLRASGFEIEERVASGGGFPLSRNLGPYIAGLVDRWALSAFPGLFGYQFVFRCVLGKR